MELQEFWKNALSEIELQISRPNFATWLKNSQLIDKKDGIALVSLPNNFAKDWVQNKYNKIILAALRNLDDTTKKIEFVVDSAQQAVAQKQTKILAEKNFGQLTFSELKIDPETNLNPRYTLNSFVVGKNNELAYAAALAVIQDIGSKYNPLFIYGGVGVGKTHLIQAIGNEIKKLYQDKVKVKYLNSEKFLNEVVQAIRAKRMDTTKEKFRTVDVFIIDDIQFIAGKEATEEEFFHTFNALHENNKQIIISSDKAPGFIPTLSERLRSRFQAGMVADISHPTHELKLAIIKNKLLEWGAVLSDEVISTIATRAQKNLREVEGILNKILFYKNVKNIEITQKIAEGIINESTQELSSNTNPKQVLKAVSETFEISPTDLIGRSRKKELVNPRQIAMYILRDVLSLSYPYIGDIMGKRDHTTAIYAYEKISEDINKNPALNQKILTIKNLLVKS